MVELLSTKLFIPPLRPNPVPRPRLIQQIRDGLGSQRRLTLVSAPAGFAKTTLVSVWLSLDEADNLVLDDYPPLTTNRKHKCNLQLNPNKAN